MFVGAWISPKQENDVWRRMEKPSDQATIKQIAERRNIYLFVLNSENINHAYNQQSESSNHQANTPLRPEWDVAHCLRSY